MSQRSPDNRGRSNLMLAIYFRSLNTTIQVHTRVFVGVIVVVMVAVVILIKRLRVFKITETNLLAAIRAIQRCC